MTDPQDTQQKFTLMANRNLLSVILLGAGIGLLMWGIGWALKTYVFASVACGATMVQCDASAQYAEIAAAILIAIVALIGLVRLRIFRPLLVVLAVTMSLWGLSGLVSTLPLQWALPLIAGLYAIAYGLFVWIVRVRVFWVAALLTVLLVGAVRWALVA
jgi:hypothetical protein